MIKTAEEIAKMRVAGRLASEVLDFIEPHITAGITTDELDQLCHNYIVNEQQAIPAPLKLSRLSKIYLHIGKQCDLPRHPRR